MKGRNTLLLAHEKYGSTPVVFFKALQKQGNSSRVIKSMTNSMARAKWLDPSESLPFSLKDLYGRQLSTMAMPC